MNHQIASALKDWVPYKLTREKESLNCRWLYLGDRRINDPFFDDTIGRCQNLPENSKMLKCVSAAEVLPGWASQVDNVAPSAIIFHISRCGSTLISQLLSLQPGNIVLAEVPIFDQLLRDGKKKNDMRSVIPLVKAAIDIYGTKRHHENRLFIKADSWHIHFYEELRQLYPKVPFIFLYRRPDEVIRSHQKKRGMQAVPGVVEPEVFGFDPEAITQIPLDEYMAKVIEGYLEAFTRIIHHDEHAHLVNYNEGGLAIVNKIAALTGTNITRSELTAMQERSGFHAKNPADVFNEPVMEAPPYSFLERSFQLYEALEKIRQQKNVAALS